MSIQAWGWASEQKTGSPATKFVLLTLADIINDDGLCVVSQSYIANKCDMSQSAVSKALKKLESMGLITTIRNSVNNIPLGNVYKLNCPKEEV